MAMDVDEEGDVDEVVVEVVEVESAEDVDDVLEMLSVDLVFVDAGLGKMLDITGIFNCLSWSNFKARA